MTVKRIILIVCILALSIACYIIMETKYDPLARYQYANASNRNLILKYMDQDDIDYIITQNIKPEQFMKFIDLEGFDGENCLYYDTCYHTRKADYAFIIKFSNKYRSIIPYSVLEDTLKNYSYDTIEEFYNGAYTYVQNANLVPTPDALDLVLGNDEVLYKYKPTGLKRIDNSIIPSASITNTNRIYVKKEVVKPLKEMIAALETEIKKKYGGLILTSGYIGYNRHIKLYEKALVEYGYDDILDYIDYPGQSESQLGYTLTFTIAKVDPEKIVETKQYKWLEEHAKEYGFILRYDKNTKRNPLTLRYVGDVTKEEGFDAKQYLSKK